MSARTKKQEMKRKRQEWITVLVSAVVFLAIFWLLREPAPEQGSVLTASVSSTAAATSSATSVTSACLTIAKNMATNIHNKAWTSFDTTLSSYQQKCGTPMLSDTCGSLRLSFDAAVQGKSSGTGQLLAAFRSAQCDDTKSKQTFCGSLQDSIKKTGQSSSANAAAQTNLQTYCTCDVIKKQINQTNDATSNDTRKSLVDNLIDMSCINDVASLITTGSFTGVSGTTTSSAAIASTASGTAVKTTVTVSASCDKIGSSMLDAINRRQWSVFDSGSMLYQKNGCGAPVFHDSCASLRQQMTATPSGQSKDLADLETLFAERSCGLIKEHPSLCGDYLKNKADLETQKSGLFKTSRFRDPAIAKYDTEIAALDAKFSPLCNCPLLSRVSDKLAKSLQLDKKDDEYTNLEYQAASDNMIALKCTYALLEQPPSTLLCSDAQHPIQSCTKTFPSTCTWSCMDNITKQIAKNQTCDNGTVYQFCNTTATPIACQFMCVRPPTRKEKAANPLLCSPLISHLMTACTMTKVATCTEECFPN